MIRWITFLFIFFVKSNYSLKIDEYILSMGDLLFNERFIQEYEQRTLKLFSDPEYLRGPQINPFPCPISLMQSNQPNKTVHQLTPHDIQCVAAIGDSLTAALGAHAATPIGLLTEFRGENFIIASSH